MGLNTNSVGFEQATVSIEVTFCNCSLKRVKRQHTGRRAQQACVEPVTSPGPILKPRTLCFSFVAELCELSQWSQSAGSCEECLESMNGV